MIRRLARANCPVDPDEGTGGVAGLHTECWAAFNGGEVLETRRSVARRQRCPGHLFAVVVHAAGAQRGDCGSCHTGTEGAPRRRLAVSLRLGGDREATARVRLKLLVTIPSTDGMRVLKEVRSRCGRSRIPVPARAASGLNA